MARISGVNLPKEKRIEIGLTYIKGIGRTQSKRLLAEANVSSDTKVKDLTETEESGIRNAMAGMLLEADLTREEQLAIKHYMDIGTYRGVRHSRRLPVRGQRTKTNARTKRGKKLTMGSGRTKEQKK